jgi:hypothetical protein
MPQFVDDFFLIIPLAAIGRSYSPAKFDCPDAATLTDRFCSSVSLCAVRLLGSQPLHDGAPAHGPLPANACLAVPRGMRIGRETPRTPTTDPGATCFGLRVPYTAPRQLPHGRGPRAACGAGARSRPRGERAVYRSYRIYQLRSWDVRRLTRHWGVDPR